MAFRGLLASFVLIGLLASSRPTSLYIRTDITPGCLAKTMARTFLFLGPNLPFIPQHEPLLQVGLRKLRPTFRQSLLPLHSPSMFCSGSQFTGSGSVMFLTGDGGSNVLVLSGGPDSLASTAQKIPSVQLWLQSSAINGVVPFTLYHLYGLFLRLILW